MKKSLSILGVSLLLTACGGEEKKTQTTTVPTTENASTTPVEKAPRAGKTYTVMTERESPPFIVRDQYGNASGFEYDLLEAIAEKKGFNLNYAANTWEGMFQSLEDGKVDIIASNISVTPERQQKYNFAKPHFQSSTYTFSKPSGTSIATWKDLTGKKVAVQQETYQQDLAGKYGLNVTPYASAYLGVRSVFAGEQDIFIGDKGVVLHFHKQYPDSLVSELPDEAEKDMIAMAVKKGDAELLKLLNEGLDEIRADGTYDKIYNKWLGDDHGTHVSSAAK